MPRLFRREQLGRVDRLILYGLGLSMGVSHTCCVGKNHVTYNFENNVHQSGCCCGCIGTDFDSGLTLDGASAAL